MKDPVTFVDNILHTPCGDFPAKITALFHGSPIYMITVDMPGGRRSYPLPEKYEQLKDDIKALCAESDALSFDGCLECLVQKKEQ